MSQSSIMIVAGEVSGDRHAAGLVRELNRLAPHLEWYGSGGSRMRRCGVELLSDVSRLAAIGPRAAFSNLGAYWKLYRDLLDRARRDRPRLAILVDFPEFNLILARALKELGIPVCVFISPQIWAWRTSRIEKIRRYVDLILVIFPFEEEFYRRYGIEAHYVGNPSVGLRRAAVATQVDVPRPPRLALLPGSRRREVEQILPLQLEVVAELESGWPVGADRPRYRVVCAPGLPEGLIESTIEAAEAVEGVEIEISRQPLAEALADVDFALVKSGTSTLEALLLQVPFAMMYRLSTTSWLFASVLVETPVYCLANIVAGEKIVEEFVQQRAVPRDIADHVMMMVRDPERRRHLRRRLGLAARSLGDRDAYPEAARRVARFLSERKEAA